MASSVSVYTAVRATGTITLSGQPSNADTVTIGSKTYTFKSSYTNVDGDVTIGADAAHTILNLQAAVNLGAGAGTAYAVAMTANGEAKISAVTSTTATVSALDHGTIGNHLPLAKSGTNLAVSGTTLSGGTGSGNADRLTFVKMIQASGNVNAEVESFLEEFVTEMS
jgi:hypothetical protein